MRIVLLASIILQAIAIGMSFAENIGKEKQRIIRYTGWFLLLIYMIFGWGDWLWKIVLFASLHVWWCSLAASGYAVVETIGCLIRHLPIPGHRLSYPMELYSRQSGQLDWLRRRSAANHDWRYHISGSCSKCYYENLSGKGCGDKKCSKERMIFSLSWRFPC